MDDAARVGVGQSAGDLRRLCERQPATLERAAFDELHHDAGQPVVLVDVVHAHEVRVRERARDPRLAEKARTKPLVAGEVGCEHLQRDPPADLGVARCVDDGHAAAAELALELVPRRPSPRCRFRIHVPFRGLCA